ncbi:acetamidase [Lepidopterella palustris CBS 459.81]|uniref:Acetamidase n=1 Tax=Lepidopterella palustris CBS 459.81 TaxID=1314670 RepID=A0A8E2JK84_9PEZI|nr:acetamidase [Lepidopterella palustris CBS 459.81]
MDNIAGIITSISSGVVSAERLCLSYIKSLTEVLFDVALQRAKELDQYFKEHRTLVGPLHGVPMTLKDQFDVKGYDSTLGYVGRAFKQASGDAVLVALLKQLGAVVIAKTNLPQSIMWCETENPLWGLTVHPENPEFTPGGSTGGESALLSLCGSVVGWGTDIGGSVRIPAHMLGLYGLKPSSGRLPYHGVAVSTEGQEHVPSVVGPLSRNLDSLTIATKTIIDAAPWTLDPKCYPVPWRNDAFLEVQSRPLVIGLLADDGVVKVHPPIARILEEVANKLRNAGHEVLPWDPSDNHRECIETMDEYYTADGGEDIRRDVEAGGEPYIPHVEALVNRGQPISVYAYWQLNRRKLAAQKSYLDKWNAAVSPISGRIVDALLAPVMPHSAVPHRKCRWVGYTKVWNFLDYTALSLPAGAVSKNLDSRTDAIPSYEPRNELDRWNWDWYDADSMDGMAVNVQIVGRKLEEEKVLGISKVIERLIKH